MTNQLTRATAMIVTIAARTRRTRSPAICWVTKAVDWPATATPPSPLRVQRAAWTRNSLPAPGRMMAADTPVSIVSTTTAAGMRGASPFSNPVV